MPFVEAIWLALAQIRVQKLKSFFTLLGVTIGVMFLIAVISIVQGMSSYMENEFAARSWVTPSVAALPGLGTSGTEKVRACSGVRASIIRTCRRGDRPPQGSLYLSKQEYFSASQYRARSCGSARRRRDYFTIRNTMSASVAPHAAGVYPCAPLV